MIFEVERVIKDSSGQLRMILMCWTSETPRIYYPLPIMCFPENHIPSTSSFSGLLVLLVRGLQGHVDVRIAHLHNAATHIGVPMPLAKSSNPSMRIPHRCELYMVPPWVLKKPSLQGFEPTGSVKNWGKGLLRWPCTIIDQLVIQC